MITEGPFPYFAQLRWGTLAKVLSGCGLHVLILSSIVQPAVMHRQTLVQLVRQSVANPRFTHQLAFVTWLSAWLRALQRCERVMPLQMHRNTVMKHLSTATGKATCLRSTQSESWMLASEKQRLGTPLSSAITSGSWRMGWRCANGWSPHEE